MKIISLPMFRSLVFGSTMMIELVEVYILNQSTEPDYTFALTDRKIEFDGRTYLPAGFHRPQVRESLQDAMSETSIVLPDVGRSLALLMETSELAGSRVVIRRTTESRRLASESFVRYEGKIQSVTVQGATVSLSLVGMVSDLSGLRTVPARSYIVGCEYRFGDPHTCTFDLPSFTVGCVIGPGSNRLRLMTEAITAAQAARGWNPSAIRFTSGINTGQSRPVADVREGMIVLRKPFYTSPKEGDAFDLIRQCPKTGEACDQDFDNYPNFGGHEYGPKDPRRIVRNNPNRI